MAPFRYFCHECQQRISDVNQSPQDPDNLQCTLCGGFVVEEITDESDLPEDFQHLGDIRGTSNGSTDSRPPPSASTIPPNSNGNNNFGNNPNIFFQSYTLSPNNPSDLINIQNIGSLISNLLGINIPTQTSSSTNNNNNNSNNNNNNNDNNNSTNDDNTRNSSNSEQRDSQQNGENANTNNQTPTMRDILSRLNNFYSEYRQQHPSNSVPTPTPTSHQTANSTETASNSSSTYSTGPGTTTSTTTSTSTSTSPSGNPQHTIRHTVRTTRTTTTTTPTANPAGTQFTSNIPNARAFMTNLRNGQFIPSNHDYNTSGNNNTRTNNSTNNNNTQSNAQRTNPFNPFPFGSMFSPPMTHMSSRPESTSTTNTSSQNSTSDNQSTFNGPFIGSYVFSNGPNGPQFASHFQGTNPFQSQSQNQNQSRNQNQSDTSTTNSTSDNNTQNNDNSTEDTPMDFLTFIQGLASIFGGNGQNMFFNQGQNFGDYVFSDQHMDQIITNFMNQAMNAGRGNHPPPATDDMINNLEHQVLADIDLAEEKNSQCGICLEDYKIGDEVIKLSCKHIFHPNCVSSWLRLNGSCPICRTKLAQSSNVNSDNNNVNNNVNINVNNISVNENSVNDANCNVNNI